MKEEKESRILEMKERVNEGNETFFQEGRMNERWKEVSPLIPSKLIKEEEIHR